MSRKITFLGGGAMATACSVLLARQTDQNVALWARNPEYAADIRDNRENRRLLPGVRLPDSVYVTSDISAASADADLLVASIPTRFLRSGLDAVQQQLPPGCPVVSVIKGIENETFLRPTRIITDVLGDRPVAALGGPSHAEEIARGLPATVVAASDDTDFAREVQRVFSTGRFRVYTNADVVGVELAGALKNIVAIAAGICDGLGYGDNAKSALVTRGLAEITRFGEALGADPATFSGLAGIGDLLTTCTSRHSRNRRVGELLGQGRTCREITESMTAVAEGVSTTASVVNLAAQHEIEMPITSEVAAVLFEGKCPRDATDTLMQRPPRGE